MKRLKIVPLFIFLINSLLATEYWTPQQIITFEQNKSQMEIYRCFTSPFPAVSLSGRVNFSYPAEFLQIAHFLSQWQVLDPTSPDFGGMIEAESGQLGNVIQTDNTQEAIVVWCQYADLTGDTSTYRPNIDAAWVYIMNYPAYNEEGSVGDDYYRNHNCAWAVWGVEWYETVYQDSSFRWYADSCANYMAKHQMVVYNPESNLNAFVMGWMAGNLYHYGKWRMNPVWVDSALVIGNKVLNWANSDPINHLSDYTWAMSSGTAVWGICNSVFQNDTLAGITWIQNYAQYLPTYFDNQNPGAYVWDSAWNVALVNAYRAMHQLTANSGFNQIQKSLTDTLLALDVDDDGGIMANKLHPPTEDMSWVSAYLDVMGVDYRIQQSPQVDAGVVRFILPDTNQIFIIGDTLSVSFQVANFGFQTLTNVRVQLFADYFQMADTLIDLPFATFKTLEFPRIFPILNSGTLPISAKTEIAGDQDPSNDQQTLTLDIPQFVLVEGTITDGETGEGVGSNIIFSLPERSFHSSSNPTTGTFQIQVIPGTYSVFLDTHFPYQQKQVDSVIVGEITPQYFHWSSLRGDILLVDDDENQSYEFFVKDGLNKLIADSLIHPWRAYHHWDTHVKGIFPVHRINELKRPYVIWITGNADTTALTPEERDSISYLLNSGASLLLSGKDIAESLDGNPFLNQVLHAHYGGNSTFVPRFVYGVAGDPISDNLRFSTWGGFGANNQLYDRDVLIPIPPARRIFHYMPQDSLPAGIRVEENYKLVFLGFGIEGIRDNFPPYNNRHELLAAVFNWFEGVSDFQWESGASLIIEKFQIFPSYPNPFNSRTNLRFAIDKPQHVQLEIYNVLGEKVKTILASDLAPGSYRYFWDGSNNSGITVSSGIYYVRLKGEFHQKWDKLLFIK
ncbi:MAG: hypothetical protein Kow0042_22570 [Calditrichia bacterium]